MKAKLRRQLAAKLKALGIPSKLYRGSKRLFYRRYSGRELREMLHKLELSTPGSIVNDCDYLNHVVKGFRPYRRFYNTNRAWHGRGVQGYFLNDSFQVEFIDGRWSCGCPASPCDPFTREDIENHLRQHLLDADSVLEDDLDERSRRLRDALRTGRHIVDEQGLLLSEFQEVLGLPEFQEVR